MTRLLMGALALAMTLTALSAPAANAATVHVVGFVPDPGAHFIAEGTVTAYDGAGELVQETPNNFGDFELDLEPGTYTLVFSGSEAWDSAGELTSVFTVENVVIAADQSGVLQVAAPPTVSATLRGISADDEPAGMGGHLTCRLYEEGVLVRYLRTTGLDDYLAHGFVVPQDAEEGSGCTATVHFHEDDYDGVSKEVVMTADGPNEFTVQEPRPVTVSGRVTTPTGPASQGDVHVYSSKGRHVRHTEIESDGSYSVELPPGQYEFRFQVGRDLELWASSVSVTADRTLDSPEPWFPVTVHVVDSAGDTSPPSDELELDCQDLVRIVGGGTEFEGLYEDARLRSVAPMPAPGGTVTLPGMEIRRQSCDLNLVEDDARSWLGSTRFRNGERDLTYDIATGEVIEGSPTTDTDGVPDAVEDGAPNGGDGNNDGTPDSEQAHVTSLPANGVAGGTDYVTLAGPSGVPLTSVSSMDVDDVGTPVPEGMRLPSGLVSFTLAGVAEGSTHTVSLFTGPTDGLNGYAKFDWNTATWSSLPANRVQLFADHIDVTLTDGGTGDDDMTVNGQISDPGGIAVVPVQSDTDPPLVTGAPTTSPNANGWYRSSVRIDWSATDPGSGVAAQPADTVVSEQGGDVTATSPQVCDLAPTPNCATGSVTGLKIDRTAPSLSVTGVDDGTTYLLGAAPTASCAASDGISGLAGPCTGVRVGGNRNGVGSFTYAATVVDKAGNRRTVSADYRVVYRFDGFAAPLNNPPTATSVFRKGSTVPAAFSLRRANGQVVTPVSAPVWVTPAQGPRSSLPVNESSSTAKATTGSNFVWRNGRWEYAWSTRNATAGHLYRIGVRLDDGTTRYLTIGLR